MNIDKINEIEQNLKKYSQMNTDEVLHEFDTSLNGLSCIIIDEKQEEYGKNIIDINKNNTTFKRLKEAFINPFNIVLIIVAIVTFFTDVVFATNKDYLTFTLIISTVFISAMISFFQQTNSNKAAQKLKSLITNKIDVIRDELPNTVDVENIVPGDILKLSSGDMIPGDVRFLETKDLFIDQASLTGESNPVEKFSTLREKDAELAHLSNIGFTGTNIVSGRATAVVLAIGSNTYFGNMAKSIYSTSEQNSFERGVDSVSKLLIKFMVIMIPVIFAINFFTKGNWWEALIFAITIAVGLTPEMLPVIMTSTLANGAIEMSKNKTIVKRLSAIQTFGEMNILCTDKTRNTYRRRDCIRKIYGLRRQ